VWAAERDQDGVSSKASSWPVSRLQSAHLRQCLFQPVQRQEVLLCSRLLPSRSYLQRYELVVHRTLGGATND